MSSMGSTPVERQSQQITTSTEEGYRGEELERQREGRRTDRQREGKRQSHTEIDTDRQIQTDRERKQETSSNGD